MPTFYEFFAGGGMVRAGLGSGWDCVFANDFDHRKGRTYAKNWGGRALIVDDIRNIAPDDLPGQADLVWGSFPCQDLSLAGGGAGLRGDRSGAFWPFMSQIRALKAQCRPPKAIAIENVIGTLTSHRGADFAAICGALGDLGYRYGALVIDAALFVPQSRPRLFVVAVRDDIAPGGLADGPRSPWHTTALRRSFGMLPQPLRERWLWWDMPEPDLRVTRFADVIEDDPVDVGWRTDAETRALLSMMSEINLAKVRTARAAGVRTVGGVYRRTRIHQGSRVQRAEVRFDDVAGCLRTPAGGSSRQSVLVIEGARTRSRLISARETARLMGLPDAYALPQGYNEAYHLTGDGVVVPVVRHLARHVIEPAVAAARLGDRVPAE